MAMKRNEMKSVAKGRPRPVSECNLFLASKETLRCASLSKRRLKTIKLYFLCCCVRTRCCVNYTTPH